MQFFLSHSVVVLCNGCSGEDEVYDPADPSIPSADYFTRDVSETYEFCKRNGPGIEASVADAQQRCHLNYMPSAAIIMSTTLAVAERGEQWVTGTG